VAKGIGTEIGSVRVVLLPGPLLRDALTAGPGWHELGHRMLDRSKATAPVSSDDRNVRPGNAGSGGGPTGSLVESMELRFVYGGDPRIEIGSKLTVGDAGYSLFDIVESGTDPHPITGNPTLAFDWPKAGGVVFLAHVNHPGTKKNPFVQRAMQRVIQESGGLAVSA
jgi:hypothetical protein